MLERIPKWLVDVGLTLLVLVLAAGNAIGTDEHPLVVVAAVAGSLVLLARRRRPLVVLALVAAATLAFGFADTSLLVPSLLVAMYSVGAFVPRTRSLRAAAAALAVTAVAFVVNEGSGPGSSLPLLVVVAAAWVFGDNARVRNERNEQREREAVAQERARIARELHDVVTHNVSVMVVQAAAGNDVFAERPERAREALQAVEETGRQALGELRRLLDVVAEPDGQGVLPQPGLGRLDELVTRVRAAGVAVELTVEGTPDALPAGVDLSAYRIVQEALTNTLKHARATQVRILIRHEREALVLEVEDDGVGGTPDPSGRGLLGMRERVEIFGGELEAAAGPAGGFVVRARLPLGAP